MPQVTARGAAGRVGAGLLGVLLSAGLAVAQAPATPSPAPAAPTGVLADPLFQSAQKRFEALPEAERKAIQEALTWTGDFSGASSGAYGPLTFRAIQAFQKRAGATVDGFLQPKERLLLERSATTARQEAKFAVLQDGKAGLRIGVPQALLPKVIPGRTGTRYAAPDNAAAIETFAQSDVTLEALYDRLKADQAGRKVTYKVLRPDWFVIAADQDGKRSYTRYAATPAGLKGFVFVYPVAAAPTFDRIAVAVANAFDPLGAASPAVAGAAPAPGQLPAPPAVPAPPAPPPVAPPGGPIATGVMVAPGKVLTVSAVESCPTPSVAGKPARVERSDKASGLVLLDVPGLRPPSAPPRAGPAPADGAALVVLTTGPAAGPEPVLFAAPGEARLPAGGDRARIFAPLQRGAAGSPVFDRSGALVGLVASVAQEPRLVAGIVPAASYPLVPAGDVARFAGLQPAPAGDGPGSTGAVAASARDLVMAVTCRR